MNIAICDNKMERVEVLLEVLREIKKKTHIFSDYFKLFNFLNESSNNNNDLVLMICDEMFEDSDEEINYFIKKFDIYIPIFTYMANQLCLVCKMYYIYEYTKYYTAAYISYLEKIKVSFLQFMKCKDDGIFIGSRFIEEVIFYKEENKEKGGKSIFPLGIKDESIENETLTLKFKQQEKKLLSCLASNYKGVRLDKIMLYIWNCSDGSKKQNAYVLIHNLRKRLKNNTNGRYTVEKKGKTYVLAKVTTP